jgi:hypothetical protein
MYIYYVWISAMLPNYQDGIVAGLVRKGYMVGPSAKDGGVTTGVSPAALISLGVYKAEETNVNNIYTDVIEVLKEIKAYYYSVIISLSTEATWSSGNVIAPTKDTAGKPTPPPLPPGTKKNMN